MTRMSVQPSALLNMQRDLPSGRWRMLSQRAVKAKKLPKGIDAVFDRAVGYVQLAIPRRRMFLKRAARILERGEALTDYSDSRLKGEAMRLRDVFRLGRETRADVDQAFAVVREVAARQIGLRAYEVQVAAALTMDAGCIAELATGEGKTLSATMPAALAGWRGRGCHVITTNDFLAQRDADTMRKIYQFCGLSVDAIQEPMQPAERRRAYACDITYCTNKEVTADFLRDRLILGRTQRLSDALMLQMSGGRASSDNLVMRGLASAIVDEADSILIDEAVTPLIISGGGPNEEEVHAYQQAADIARQLTAKQHYRVDLRYREVRLTDAGHQRAAELSEGMGGLWRGARRREELVTQALGAIELYHLGQQYVIQEDKVCIVDEFTGRLMPDRTWRDGLHQAVEAKENLEIQPPKETLARVSFQRFFRMYHKLAGMTGTAWEARHELWQIYHVPTVRIPTHRPCIRKQSPDVILHTMEAKFAAIVEHIVEVHAEGRPILVGTRSVAASEQLSEMLTARGLEHSVLNAVRHAEEAQITAEAGQPNRITIATNMAGRGTDIKLGRGVTDKGGLHVIATERHESGRIDRQLFGRAGRQGDPGSAMAIISREDELIRRHASPLVRRLAGRLGRRAFHMAQQRAQKQALAQRRAVLKTDDWLDESLGFAGREI
jgi:preprotein translocase subunit SecA